LSLPNLKTNILGQVYHYFDELPSTHDYIKNLSSENLSDGMVVRAGFQSAGRGQMGSSWEVVPFSNLTFSIYLETKHWPASHPFQWSQWIAVSVATWVQQCLPYHEVSIKWPNDILVGNRKIAGILIENSFRGEHWHCGFVGIGLNVLQMDFPEDQVATSFQLELANCCDVEKHLEGLLSNLELVFRMDVGSAYQNLLWMKGKLQKVMIGNEEKFGWIAGTDEEGRLIFVSEDGTTGIYGMKEITFFRNVMSD
jgi:BirA family biotin operon repressor/biotin-[acetyl-CoA-carboxylase] ligase